MHINADHFFFQKFQFNCKFYGNFLINLQFKKVFHKKFNCNEMNSCNLVYEPPKLIQTYWLYRFELNHSKRAQLKAKFFNLRVVSSHVMIEVETSIKPKSCVTLWEKLHLFIINYSYFTEFSALRDLFFKTQALQIHLQNSLHFLDAARTPNSLFRSRNKSVHQTVTLSQAKIFWIDMAQA